MIEHMESENRHEFDVTIETFDHPRYELIATGDVFDGEAEVAAYFEETRTAFPDQRNELIALHHADDAVIVEAMLYGTHLGSFRGLPATGRDVRDALLRPVPVRGGPARLRARLLRRGTILRQLGIAHDPLTLRGRRGDRAQPPADGRPGAGGGLLAPAARTRAAPASGAGSDDRLASEHRSRAEPRAAVAIPPCGRR